MVREIEFTQPLTLSLLTGRRTSQPYGMKGGQPGRAGVNWLIDADATERKLPWRCQIQVDKAQRLRLETPGGGGFESVPTKVDEH
jgi:5-oxoprolinase (ATP-hydrolysing)